ncbi:MAG: CPBP family intramembrane metalloprotease [Candidatus Omnitrophica bacterium]|nr:CPBP family intramembrane metalloprotease [Candidatus Omnitrophota bacterium]
MKSFNKILAFILVFSAALLLIHFVIQLVFQKDPGLLLHHGIGQAAFYLLFVFLVFLFQKYVNREGFLQLGLRPYPGWVSLLSRGWLAGVIAFVGYSLLMKAFGIVEFKYRPGFERMIVAFLVAFSAFTIALTEEILFRGFFLQTLLKDLPKWIAVVVTGLIFVVFHDLANPLSFLTEPRQMMLAGGLFSLNILLCMAYLKSGNLFLPIGIHSGLVFAKIFFRKMKMMYATEPANSYLFGLEGDARRGVLAWILFLAGILVLHFLISDRERLFTKKAS